MANFDEIVQKHVGEDGGIPPKAIATLVSAIKTAVGNEFVDKERYKAKLTEIEELKEGTRASPRPMQRLISFSCPSRHAPCGMCPR